ncbi:VCBS repeat-containing protein, partial [Candidatus Bipolaricaulota bacterium]|nr:VCBS repeat-containing protein [Candidatus Bipolaricaulota bacterium]
EFATWDNKLCLFLNEGDRRLSRSSKSIPSLVSSPSATTYGEDVIRLLTGDLNEDAIDDVVVCESDETYVLLGDIESGLIRGESLTLSPKRITSANERQAGISLFTPILMDINADGHLDLVGVDTSSVPVRTLVWLGDGTGEFTDVAEYPYRHLFGWPSDTNGDGYDDILAWHIESGYHVLLGGSDGLLHPEVIEIEPWKGIGANLIGDLNGDGQADFAEAWGMVLWLYLGEGWGDRGERLQFAPHAEGQFSYDVTTIAGDFNGDGRPDIALPSHYQISIILNRFPETRDRE